MASVKRVEYKSGRVVYRIVICQGYDKKGNKLVKNLTYSVNQSATPKQQEREAKKYFQFQMLYKEGMKKQIPDLSSQYGVSVMTDLFYYYQEW